MHSCTLQVVLVSRHPVIRAIALRCWNLFRIIYWFSRNISTAMGKQRFLARDRERRQVIVSGTNNSVKKLTISANTSTFGDDRTCIPWPGANSHATWDMGIRASHLYRFGQRFWKLETKPASLLFRSLATHPGINCLSSWTSRGSISAETQEPL